MPKVAAKWLSHPFSATGEKFSYYHQGAVLSHFPRHHAPRVHSLLNRILNSLPSLYPFTRSFGDFYNANNETLETRESALFL